MASLPGLLPAWTLPPKCLLSGAMDHGSGTAAEKWTISS